MDWGQNFHYIPGAMRFAKNVISIFHKITYEKCAMKQSSALIIFFFNMNYNLLRRKGKALMHEKYTRETITLKVSRI
jgi:hypothetical protein